MKKGLVSVALSAIIANMAIAEESGVFLGVEAGLSFQGNTISVNNAAAEGGNGNNGNQFNNILNPDINLGGNYGLVLGYKQFFNNYIGLRYYANFNHHIVNVGGDTTQSSTTDGNGTTTTSTTYNYYTLNGFNYGVNVDLLANVIATENFDFGGFVGIGVGALTLSGEALDNINKILQPLNKKVDGTSFDAAINVGLRANIAKHHGVEIFGRIPFLFNETKLDVAGVNIATLSISHIFSVSARYTFSF